MNVSPYDIKRYVEEQILTLPGIVDLGKFIILLTSSRTTCNFSVSSDVDIDVLCPSGTFYAIQERMIAMGRTGSIENGFYKLSEENWQRYFGYRVGRLLVNRCIST
jgi:hypothetical protein